ncbi:unnamed protein product, partial [Mesorhabditis spiculigera]
MSRIQGLKFVDAGQRPPLAPMSCVLDPLKAYADRAAVSCQGKCFKFTSAKIQSDGGIELYMLRGCYDKLINSTVHPPPSDDRCYQSPDHYTHEVGVEYVSQCYCKGFMCNDVRIISPIFSLSLALLLLLN